MPTNLVFPLPGLIQGVKFIKQFQSGMESRIFMLLIQASGKSLIPWRIISAAEREVCSGRDNIKSECFLFLGELFLGKVQKHCNKSMKTSEKKPLK